jgi:hypothetical protein
MKRILLCLIIILGVMSPIHADVDKINTTSWTSVDKWGGTSSANVDKINVVTAASAITYSSDLCTGGSPTTVGTNTDGTLANVFDGNTTTWYGVGLGTFGIGYDFGAGVSHAVIRVKIYSYYTESKNWLKAFIIQGSNNNTDWTTLHTDTYPETPEGWQTYDFANTTAYRYVRVTSTTTEWHSVYTMYLSEMEMMEEAE